MTVSPMLSDAIDALLDAREHSQPEQVDLQEARVGTRVLVPLTELPARHRRRLHRDELDERTGGDHHSPGVLRDVPRQARNLLGQELKGAPALRGELALGIGERGDLIRDALRVPAVRDPCEPLELGVRQAKRLADIANRTPRAIRREAGHERCVLVAVALGDRGR